MLTKNLKVTNKAVTNNHENEIWHNGYSFGIKTGAEEVIKHLQNEINNEGRMTNADDIKLLIFHLWKQISLENTLYRICLPEEMTEEDE